MAEDRSADVTKPAETRVERELTAELVPLNVAEGTRIDRYVLGAKLGEGGMGTVFAAEQLEPVQRRVAVKVIQVGMDTKRLLRRFEAERRILALLDHPNVATILDAGSTPSGEALQTSRRVLGNEHLNTLAMINNMGILLKGQGKLDQAEP